jgi:hypothetical protein
VACGKYTATGFWSENPKKRDHLEDNIKMNVEEM